MENVLKDPQSIIAICRELQIKYKVQNNDPTTNVCK